MQYSISSAIPEIDSKALIDTGWHQWHQELVVNYEQIQQCTYSTNYYAILKTSPQQLYDMPI
jgi:hypothetical protein